MSLPHILLGLLDEPASGYDLKKVFEPALRHFWAAELSQIYPTLKQLERRGWLNVRTARSEKGPARHLYQRTEAGTQALCTWLSEGPEVGTERLTWLAQVFLLSEIGAPERALRFMVQLRDAMAARLAVLEEAEAHWQAADSRYPDLLPDPGFYRQMTLQLGLSRMAATRDWCEVCIARIRDRYQIPDEAA